jgi:hypothetical protein
MVNTLDYVLKKYSINVGKQYIIDIPNIGRDDMAKLFGELNFNVGAEIGVERGYFSEVLCKANPNLNLWCIDPWLAEAYDPKAAIHAVDTDQKKYDERYEECRNLLSKYNTNIIRDTSIGALDRIPDESLDFVYIDANHDFPNFINDLHQWSKKVKVGGIISGHDYAIFSYKKHNHVKRALDAYARCYRMQPLFIIGALEYKEGTTRDKYRSWMWVKDK